MEADEVEIQKFFDKFKQLWKSGWNAHLDLDANGGKASVWLRLQLSGNGLKTTTSSHDTLKKSNARDRRRLRRASLRSNCINIENSESDVIKKTANEKKLLIVPLLRK